MSNNSIYDIDFSLYPEFKNLTEEERQEVIKILSQISESGTSESLSDLRNEDYYEIPVDILTFLHDDRYLGRAWKDADGKFKLYEFWEDIAQQLFPDNFTTSRNILLESGARGLGKSENACGVVAAYLMYRVMCLRNPLQYYHLKPTEKICFAFLNIKLDLAEDIATSKFQKTIQASPWFMSRGTMTQKHNKPFWLPPDPIQIIIGSQSDDVIGLPIYFCFIDEISFMKNQDVDKQKKKAYDMINTAVGGMLTRFVHGGVNPTMLVVASSKRSEQSFMETYIKQLSESNPEHTLVVDEPVWKVKPKGTYSDETFQVGLGNKFLANIVIKETDDINDLIRRGYKIIDVPIDFKHNFLDDIERALCDYAGISSSSSNKYFSAERVNDCIDTRFTNPFPDIIEVGNGLDDTRQYSDFFREEFISEELKQKPLFIHLDMSMTGDMTGIAGVWIAGKKESDAIDGARDLKFQLAFATSIKAPKGHQISFEKNRNFIRWLKSRGYKIRMITSDTFQSADLQQILKQEGFNCEILSVDRCDVDHICKPYSFLKSVVYERRIVLLKQDRLFDEFCNVERNMNTGKVDHTSDGHKDCLDAVCGATFTASKYADEYAHDYGEDWDGFLVANGVPALNPKNQFVDTNDILGSSSLQQITVDFENELKKVFSSNKSFAKETNKSQEAIDAEMMMNLANQGILLF